MMSILYAASKHALDIAGASFGLVLLLLLRLTVLIRVGLGSPAFVRQEQAGRHGRPFRLVESAR